MISTLNNTAIRMWALIDNGQFLGVYNTRTAARQARQEGIHGVLKSVLVSLA